MVLGRELLRVRPENSISTEFPQMILSVHDLVSEFAHCNCTEAEADVNKQ